MTIWFLGGPMEREPFYKTPEPVGIGKEQINELAEEIAKTLNFEPGGDIEELVHNLGGKITYVDIDEWYDTNDGSIKVNGEGNFEIFVPNFTGPLRDRFTIAHELGHYFLHSNMGEKQIKVGRSGSSLVEWEANWFAASLLMPSKSFINCLQEDYTIPALSREFLVSQQAASIRKKDLESSGS